MPAQRNPGIIKALEIVGGRLSSEERASRSRLCWAIRKAGKPWMRSREDFPAVTRETAVHAPKHAKSLVVSRL
jgi:hypothetical protein